jgi:pSer/pThr/pTyr-binding forkhead associated (FHA) protein
MEIKLVVVGGKQAGTEIPVAGPKFLIGRGPECRLRPQSHLISRKHCAILLGVGTVSIEDVGSTNGTFVNGEKVQQRRELKNGDHIKLGMVELEVHIGTHVEGKKKQAAVEEAKQPAAAKPPAADDELDISSWLDDDAETRDAAPPEKPAALRDTLSVKKQDETVPMTVAHNKQAKEGAKAPPAKVVGQFQRTAKPIAESSRSAAADMLKQFAPKKK